MTDCSSIQGSTTSSSSDVTTLTTASSSWCSISTGSSRIRVIRLTRPNPRCILVTPNNNPSFGFSVRGGKEYGTGFFVSNIERYSEAYQKGLKVGDQLLRVNGYRVEDAVHKELVQFITSQDRLTLKVRGIGMLPLKEKENDPLTWRAVRASDCTTSSLSCTEDPFQAIINKRNMHSKDKRVVLNVAPRTKLGLGICKGPEWKPGIFVQFTKNKSVAREAGLRPGDQILCVNSIDFSDVLFSEAVAVMKSSSKLDMVVRTAAGCDLFPGESSGYNSSASSVTGDQSPCWADVSAKRLTVVCEEPPAVSCSNDNIYADVKKLTRCAEQERECSSASDTGTLKEVNKTIIKLSENGTSINNTFIEDPIRTTPRSDRYGLDSAERSAIKPIPPPPPPNSSSSSTLYSGAPQSQKGADVCFASRQSEMKTVVVEVHRTGGSNKKAQQLAVTTPDRVEIDVGNLRRQSESTESGNSLKKDGSESGGSLCSAIAEELRKRREKQRLSDGYNNNSNNIPKTNQLGYVENPLAKIKPLRKALGGAINTTERNAGGTSGDQHSALMDEFKRAHQRMFKNGFQESDHKERQDALRNTTIMDNREEESDNNVHRGTVDKLQNVSASNISKTSFSPDNELPETKVVSPQSKYEFTKKSLHPKFAQFNGKPESPQKPPDSPVPDYEPVQICPQPSKQGLGAASDTNPISSNSRIMRVTIGEYSQSPRKEPAKFDFLGQKHIRDEKHYSNVDGASLHSELQDTLSRSNLKKVSSASALDVSDYRRLEHQSHCQLQNSNHIGGISNSSKEYTNIEKLTRMLQCKQDEDVASTRSTSSALRSHVKLENTGNGILKNGSNQRSSRSSKNSEKSISFGN